ncbi:MAG: hypothetical protein LBQ00_05835 [Syntrophobacterales bacterium]|jgi:hypothetical protein|nr:hypothetical protein [Syntrophobacterales bacterium]
MKAKRSAYSRWLKRFFAILLALLTLVTFFNIFVDGVGIFSLGSGLKYMTLSLLNGKMIAGRMSYDEREFQRLVVEQYSARRDMVVIGSSRTMVLRKRFIGGNPDFFNHSVSGAVLQDLFGIVGLYREKGIFPATVILGIDPWMFNKNNGLGKSWRTLDSCYQEITAEIKNLRDGGTAQKNKTETISKESRFARYAQLINLDYTIQNLEFLRSGNKLRITDTVEIDDFVREPDGSIHFPYGMRRMRMIKDGPSNAMPDIYFKDFKSLYGTGQFEGLVHYLNRQEVRVVFFLPPFHGAAYQSCFTNSKYGIVPEIETYIRDFAQQNGIAVIGSYNPALYGFKGEDFFDGTHAHETVMKKLFEGFR